MGTLTHNIILSLAGIATAALLVALVLVAPATVAGASGPVVAKSQGWLRPKVDKRHKPLYDGLWRRKVSPENRRWARKVATCESGRNPDVLGAGGLYRGAFQFSESAWKTSPKSPGGDPIAYSYRTQAFVAVRLRTQLGDGPWPNCA